MPMPDDSLVTSHSDRSGRDAAGESLEGLWVKYLDALDRYTTAQAEIARLSSSVNTIDHAGRRFHVLTIVTGDVLAGSGQF